MSKKKTKVTPKGFVTLPIQDLVICKWNYKKFDNGELQKKLVANIKRNGQIENILVRDLEDGTFEVVNGNHRYLALQELKYAEVQCYNLGKISETQAKRIALETNETKFKTDQKKLAELVDEIMKVEDEDFQDFKETNPFDDKEMEALASLIAEDGLEDDEAPADKPQKSKTAISGGGEKYTLIKMELSPVMAKRFNDTLARFSYMEGTEKPLDVLLQLIERYTNEEILELTGNTPYKSQKKARKQSVK